MWRFTYLELKAEQIDGYCVLSGVVLFSASQESLKKMTSECEMHTVYTKQSFTQHSATYLGKKEAWNPERYGFAFVVPLLVSDKINSIRAAAQSNLAI